jgi:tRNA threonylcarbamoyl adenosine modification protein YeaZ
MGVSEPRERLGRAGGDDMEREYIRRLKDTKDTRDHKDNNDTPSASLVPLVSLKSFQAYSPTMPLLLALDTGSPQVSVALGRDGRLLAERSVEIDRSSGRLLEMIAEVLAAAGARPADLEGVLALQGPGSFTGLRIGLATALGLHQALGVPATAIPTLRVLAARAAEPGTIVAAVDALRGEWSAQAFNLNEPLSGMELVHGGNLPSLVSGITAVTGFGVSRLAELPDWPAEIRLIEGEPLAATALRLVPGEWDSGLLIHPLYSRPPAITAPRRRHLS